MQPCKTGHHPYSDASPNGECSLVQVSNLAHVCLHHLPATYSANPENFTVFVL